MNTAMTFLPEEAINDPRALHNIFVEMREAYASEKVPMTKEQSEMFIKVYMSDESAIDGIFKDLIKTFPIGGFMLRVEIFPIKFEKRLLVLLGALYCEYGIGGMILIGYYLEWLAALTAQSSLTVDWVSSDVWPFGIFSKETIHKFWDKQKVKARPDNLIDHATAASSFLTTQTA